MRSSVFWSIFILALFATGCITEYNAVLPSSDQQILIVDGCIMSDTTVIFQFSKNYPLNSSYTQPNTFNIDATVTIIGNNGYESAPATSLGNGAYSINAGTLDDNVKYGIKIVYNDDTYQSALSKPLHTPEIDSISLQQPEKNGPVGICVSTHDNNTGESEFFLWDYTENWEFDATYFTDIFFNPKDSTFYVDSLYLATTYQTSYYHCWRHNDSKNYMLGSTELLNENRIINKQLYQINPAADNRLRVLYCTTINQKAISKSAYDYYQNRIKLNEEMGGLFTPQPSNLDGNITCITNPSKRAIGYVEVTKNTVQKRLFVYPSQITSPLFSDDCQLYSLGDLIKELNLDPKMSNDSIYGTLYVLGYRPALDPAMPPYPFLITPDKWSFSRCTDCRDNGGTKNKPDFWPNNDQ